MTTDGGASSSSAGSDRRYLQTQTEGGASTSSGEEEEEESTVPAGTEPATTPAATEETSSAASSSSAATESTTAGTDAAAAAGTKPATTPAATEETSSAVSSSSTATETTTAGTDAAAAGTKPATTPATTEETSSAASSSSAATETTTAGTDATAPAAETNPDSSHSRFPNGTPVSKYDNGIKVDGIVARYSNDDGDYIVKWDGEDKRDIYSSSNAEDMQKLTKMTNNAMDDTKTTAGTTTAGAATAATAGGPKINYGLWNMGLDDSVCFEETDGYGFGHDKSLNGARISHILSMVAGSIAMLLTLIECIKCKIIGGKKLQGFILFFAFVTGLCVFMVFGCAMCGGDMDATSAAELGGLFGNTATSTAAATSSKEHWENFNHLDHNAVLNGAANTFTQNQYLEKLVSSFKSKCEWEEGASYNLIATLLYFTCMILCFCTPAASPMFGGIEESSPLNQTEDDETNDLQLRPEWTDKEIA